MVRGSAVWPLWQGLVAGRAVPVTGAIRDGTVDLGIGRPALGPLPEYDRRLLSGSAGGVAQDAEPGGPPDPGGGR